MEAEWTRVKLRKHESNAVPNGKTAAYERRSAKKGIVRKELLNSMTRQRACLKLTIFSGIQKQIKCQEKV